MTSLRRRVFLFIAWTSIFVLFTIHLILSRDNHGHDIFLTQTRKNYVPDDHRISEEVVVVKMNLQSSEHPADDVSKQLHVNTYTTENELKLLNFTRENNFLHGGIQKSTPKIDSLVQIKDENTKLKAKISNLSKELDKLLKSKKQLQLLTKRLVAQHNGKAYLPKLDPTVPWVFAVTPTFTRYTQKADLVRLSQTLQHVTNMHWIIVEDSKDSTQVVRNVLLDSGLSFTHLHVKTPSTMARKKGEKYNKHHRGVPQRNLALNWIRKNINVNKTPGVVYFMDDDNTYHKEIFEEMRWTNKVSAWPVALTGAARFQGPVVTNGKVTSFHSNWALDRNFTMDMAAFAVNLRVLLKDFPKVEFDENAKRGHLEPTFLSAITTMEQLEPLASNCTKVLVWHTRTAVAKESIKGEKALIKAGRPSNPDIET